jgi:oligopeptide transport system substrate-binding protein
LLGGCRKAPKAEGHVLRVSQRNEPSDLDPATASLPDEFFIIRALSEGLLVPNPAGGAPLPAAASRYETSPDGLTYTFHLRENARWSNGEPVVADDFVASYRRVLTPATAAPKANLFFAVKNAQAFATGALKDFTAVGIRAADEHTLVITLIRPARNFPLYVASGPWIPINPRTVATYGRTWTQPAHYVGNGPFVLAEWRPQQRIIVQKNPRYLAGDHIALEEIQFIRFDSGETEERAFRAGQLDVTMAVPQSKLDWYAHEHPEELHRDPLAETRFIAFNTTRTPLTDARIRRALALAIDREKLVTYVMRGGQQPAYRFLSPGLIGGADKVDGDLRAPSGTAALEERARRSRSTSGTLTFDPAEARRLLADAGFPDGKGFPPLELAGWDRSNAVLEAVQEMWRRELGIQVRLIVHEAKVHLAALNSGNYDIAFVTNLLDVRDPAAALADFTASAPNNFPHWRSVEFDQLVADAAAAGDEATAMAKLESAEALLLRDAAIAPLYFNTQNWLMSPRVHHWEQDALWARRYDQTSVEQ